MEEMHENLSDTDFHSKKFKMLSLIKNLKGNLRNLRYFLKMNEKFMNEVMGAVNRVRKNNEVIYKI